MHLSVTVHSIVACNQYFMLATHTCTTFVFGCFTSIIIGDYYAEFKSQHVQSSITYVHVYMRSIPGTGVVWNWNSTNAWE